MRYVCNWTLAGGFLGGSVKAVHDFYGEYHHILNDTLQEGLMDDDQYVFVMAWCRRPDLIKLHKCYHKFVPPFSAPAHVHAHVRARSVHITDLLLSAVVVDDPVF